MPKTTADKRQVDFLKRLFSERENNPDAQKLRRATLALYQADGLTHEIAAKTITAAQAIPRDKPQKEVPEGFDVFAGEWIATATEMDVYLVDDERYVVEKDIDSGWITVSKLSDLTREERYRILERIMRDYA